MSNAEGGTLYQGDFMPLGSEGLKQQKFKLIINPEHHRSNDLPIVNAESLGIISRGATWLSAKSLEELTVSMERPNKKPDVLNIHPLFNRRPARFVDDYPPLEGGVYGLTGAIEYVDYINNKGKYSKREASIIQARGPYNQGKCLFYAFGGAPEFSLFNENAYKNPFESPILYSICHAPYYLGYRLDTFMNRQDEYGDAGIGHEDELKYAKSLVAAIDIVSRFSYLIARDPRLDVSELDREISDYKKFMEERDELKQDVSWLYTQYPREEASQRGPTEVEIATGKKVLQNTSVLLGNVDEYLKKRTGN